MRSTAAKRRAGRGPTSAPSSGRGSSVPVDGKPFDVVVEARARVEMADAGAWYEEKREGLGAAFFDEIDAALAVVAAAPFLRVPLPRAPSVRRIPLRRFPYGVYFAVRGSTVHVLSVTHEKRHPETWEG